MLLGFTLFIAIAPCLFWLWAVVRHDDHEREPWQLVVLALLLGAIATVGVLWSRPWCEALLAPLTPAVEAFLVTALCEELWKLAALLPLMLMNEVDEPLDGGVYGAAVGLGFAAVENVMCVHHGGDAVLLLQRAFTATLVHACCTGCLGIAWAEGKLRQFGLGTPLWLAFGLAIAIGLHGTYNVFLYDDASLELLSLLLILPAAVALLAVKIHWARRRSRDFHPRP